MNIYNGENKENNEIYVTGRFTNNTKKKTQKRKLNKACQRDIKNPKLK